MFGYSYIIFVLILAAIALSSCHSPISEAAVKDTKSFSNGLPVSNGNSTRDTLDDENRFLRQKLSQVENALSQLEKRMQAIESRLLHTTNGGMPQPQPGVGQQQNEAISFYTSCDTFNYAPPPDRGHVLFQIECPQGRLLQSANYGWAFDMFYLSRIVCCS